MPFVKTLRLLGFGGQCHDNRPSGQQRNPHPPNRVVASKTLRLPHVQQYMMEQVGQHLALSSISSVKRLRHLVDHARSEYVQLEASKDILDRVGFKQPDKVKHTLDGDISVNIDLS